MSNKIIKVSRLLSYMLRHHPEEFGLTLDRYGWAGFDDVLRALRVKMADLTREEVMDVIQTNDKQRFALEGNKIRANQGHSIPIDLDLTPLPPPKTLWHGTAVRSLNSIFREGLTRQKRSHVHLTEDLEIANKTGARHGKPAVLLVLAHEQHQAGFEFFKTANNVWLVTSVPVGFLEVYSIDGFPQRSLGNGDG